MLIWWFWNLVINNFHLIKSVSVQVTFQCVTHLIPLSDYYDSTKGNCVFLSRWWPQTFVESIRVQRCRWLWIRQILLGWGSLLCCRVTMLNTQAAKQKTNGQMARGLRSCQKWLLRQTNGETTKTQAEETVESPDQTTNYVAHCVSQGKWNWKNNINSYSMTVC